MWKKWVQVSITIDWRDSVFRDGCSWLLCHRLIGQAIWAQDYFWQSIPNCTICKGWGEVRRPSDFSVRPHLVAHQVWIRYITDASHSALGQGWSSPPGARSPGWDAMGSLQQPTQVDPAIHSPSFRQSWRFSLYMLHPLMPCQAGCWDREVRRNCMASPCPRGWVIKQRGGLTPLDVVASASLIPCEAALLGDEKNDKDQGRWSGHGGGGDRVLWVLAVPVPTAELPTACMRVPGGWIGCCKWGYQLCHPLPTSKSVSPTCPLGVGDLGVPSEQHTLPSYRVGARIRWWAEMCSTSNSRPETEP